MESASGFFKCNISYVWHVARSLCICRASCLTICRQLPVLVNGNSHSHKKINKQVRQTRYINLNATRRTRNAWLSRTSFCGIVAQIPRAFDNATFSQLLLFMMKNRAERNMYFSFESRSATEQHYRLPTVSRENFCFIFLLENAQQYRNCEQDDGIAQQNSIPH